MTSKMPALDIAYLLNIINILMDQTGNEHIQTKFHNLLIIYIQKYNENNGPEDGQSGQAIKHF